MDCRNSSRNVGRKKLCWCTTVKVIHDTLTAIMLWLIRVLNIVPAAWVKPQQQGCPRPLLYTTTSHLDDTGGSPHVDEVLPLQHGPEAALQRDDSPQDFLVEGGLKALAFCLPQKHLHHVGRFKSGLRDGTKKGNRLISRHPTIVLPTWYPAGGRWIRLKNSLMPDLVGLVPRGSSTKKWRTKSCNIMSEKQFGHSEASWQFLVKNRI